MKLFFILISVLILTCTEATNDEISQEISHKHRTKRAFIPAVIIPATTSVRIAQVINSAASVASRSASTSSRVASTAAAGATGSFVSNSGGSSNARSSNNNYGASSGDLPSSGSSSGRESPIENVDTGSVVQTCSVWCAPAVAQSTLEAFGLTWERIQVSEAFQNLPVRPRNFQSFLAYAMKTRIFVRENRVIGGGTPIRNFVDVLNGMIQYFNLNGMRLYRAESLTEFTLEGFTQHFFNQVRSSLQQAKPVPFAYSAEINHFILIRSVAGSPTSPTYVCMDPMTGLTVLLSHRQIYDLVRGTSYLVV